MDPIGPSSVDSWPVFSFSSYSNARKKGQFLHFLLKIAEKEETTDLEGDVALVHRERRVSEDILTEVPTHR